VRNAFAAEIAARARTDERVVLLSGDIGNRLFDDFKAAQPGRFYNCGVAEASMIGIAAGLAMCGLRPVVYTIASFATVRCLEQIRVDVCYHRQPVVIVGTGAGLSYASLGGTHHSCEDVALLRALPEMTVVCPADAHEVRGAVRAALAHDGPVYVRIGKKGEPELHADAPAFVLGRSITMREGERVALLGVGNGVALALEAADLLRTHGIAARVESFHTVKPLDEALLDELFDRFEVVATVEEHSVVGGAGSAVAEWETSRSEGRKTVRARFVRAGTEDRFLHEAGSQAHARRRLGLTAEGVAGRVLAALEARA
jgi:transketolase